MSASVAYELVDMTCRNCGHECDARAGESILAEPLNGRTLHYQHAGACPSERERALRYSKKEAQE